MNDLDYIEVIVLGDLEWWISLVIAFIVIMAVISGIFAMLRWFILVLIEDVQPRNAGTGGRTQASSRQDPTSANKMGKMFRWLQRRMVERSPIGWNRVLQREISRWPRIYCRKDQPCYKLVTYFRRPVQKKLSNSPVMGIAALAVGFFWELGSFDGPPQTLPSQIQWFHHGLWPYLIMFFGVTVIAEGTGWTRVRMFMSIDGIRWRGIALKRCSIPLTDVRGATAVVLEKHTKAADELATDVLNQKNTYPVYRAASEVVMKSGFTQHVQHQIAEFRNDSNKIEAGQMQAAVTATIEAFLAEIAASKVRGTSMVDNATLD